MRIERTEKIFFSEKEMNILVNAKDILSELYHHQQLSDSKLLVAIHDAYSTLSEVLVNNNIQLDLERELLK